MRVICPNCQAAYACPDEHRGKRLRCNKCQQVFVAEAAAPVRAQGLADQGPGLAAPPRPAEQPTPPPIPSAKGKARVSTGVVIAGTLAVGLLFGGVGAGLYFVLTKPAAPADAPEPVQPAPNEAKPAVASGSPDRPGQAAGGGAKVSGTAALDVSYLADDFFVALVVQPGRLAKSPVVAGLLEEPLLNGLVQQTGFDPRKISSVVVAMDPAPAGAERHSPSVIVRFQGPTDGRKLIEPLVGPLTEKKRGDKTYWIGRAVSAAYLPDDRTILLAPEATLLKMMAAKAGPGGPMARKLAQLDANSDVLGVFLTGPARALLAEAVKQAPKDLPPVFAGLSSLPDRVEAAVLRLNLTGNELLHVAIEANSAESAAEVGQLLRGGVAILPRMNSMPCLTTHTACSTRLSKRRAS